MDFPPNFVSFLVFLSVVIVPKIYVNSYVTRYVPIPIILPLPSLRGNFAQIHLLTTYFFLMQREYNKDKHQGDAPVFYKLFSTSEEGLIMNVLTPVPFPSPLAVVDAFAKAFEGAGHPPTEYVRSESQMMLEESQQKMLNELMAPVQKNGSPGHYFGAIMDTDRTRLAAEMSGDHNDVHVNPKKPHPRFGRLIAHGMDAVTQATAALKLEINGHKLVPCKADISFRQPVFVDEDQLEIRIAPLEDPFALNREINVYAQNKSSPERLVVKMRMTLKKNPTFDEHAWFRSIMSAWRISALLAETWPGCLYVRQQFDFHKPVGGEQLGVYVRGDGLDSKGNCLVHTQAHDSPHAIFPTVGGQATIVLPK